mgnify:CR=1 FL=1
MKIGEKFIPLPGSETEFTVRQTFANDPYLKDVQQLRDAGVGVSGESRLVGRIPMHIVAEWIKEAGLEWSDTEAVQDLMRRKLLSGEFDAFRVWEGRF